MKQGQTNVGKKEQRQIDQRLTSAAKAGRSTEENDVQRHIVPKQHRLKGRKQK